MPNRRCSPITAFRGEAGAGRAIMRAWASTPPATESTLPAVARTSTAAVRAVSTACPGRLTRSVTACVTRLSAPGSGRGDQSSSGTSRGVGVRSRITVPMSTAETPSTIAWWVLVTTATRPSDSPSTR